MVASEYFGTKEVWFKSRVHPALHLLQKCATAGPYNVHVCDCIVLTMCVSWVEDGQDPMGQNIG